MDIMLSMQETFIDVPKINQDPIRCTQYIFDHNPKGLAEYSWSFQVNREPT